ncbi:2TM domain-containing protein [Leptolyngbya sp. PCC 6406]|uniref:2TM domain-containing protein n=1 Tax=Leptolyngbya sp. PCC 6406 TaxID=1173264 RepID=UPI0002ABE6FE|nr:2TM domain-containing protein [Leptolyngbya sp. PCC 6406]
MSPTPVMTEMPSDALFEDRCDLYGAEDAQAILQLAIARETESGEMSRGQLLEIAAELGISSDTLAAAEQEWQVRQVEQAERQVFDQFRQQRFQHHLIRYTVVNGFAMALNYMAADRLSWSLYLALIWGLAIALHGWHTFRPTDYRYAEEFEKWRRQQQLKRSFRRAIDWLLGT